MHELTDEKGGTRKVWNGNNNGKDNGRAVGTAALAVGKPAARGARKEAVGKKESPPAPGEAFLAGGGGWKFALRGGLAAAVLLFAVLALTQPAEVKQRYAPEAVFHSVVVLPASASELALGTPVWPLEEPGV